MKRYKIVAQIILLILSVVNFAFAAPVSVRGIADDVTTASPKSWNPSADRTNTPTSLGSSESDHRLEQELRPHDPRSPMDPNPSSQPQLSLGSTAWDYFHPLPPDSPPPAHNNLPLDTGSNDAPQPIQGPTGSSNFGPHRTGNELSSDELPSKWLDFLQSPSSESPQPHSSNTPPPQDIAQSSVRPTDDQPPLAPLSNPGSSKRPLAYPDDSDPRPSKMPYNPLGPGPSTLASGDKGPEPSTWTLSDTGPEPSTWKLGPLDRGPSTLASDSGPSTSDSSDSSKSLFTVSDPAPALSSNSNPRPLGSDPGPSIKHKAGDVFGLFRERFKRVAGYP